MSMRAALLAAAVTCTAALLPAAAAGAPYTITRCTYSALPDPLASVRTPVLSAQGTTILDQCALGYAYRMTFSNHTLNTSASGPTGFRITIPPYLPDITILSVAARATLSSKTGDASSSGSLLWVDETSGVTSSASSWPGGSTPQLGPIDFESPPTWKPTRSVLLGATCNTTCTFATRDHGDFDVERLKITLDDPTPPVAPTFAATGLLAGGNLAGTQNLAVTAADTGSGVNHVEVLTSAGVLLATTTAGDGCRPNYVEACPPSRSVELPVDTTKLPRGAQKLTVKVVDQAGNATTAQTPAFALGVPNGDSKGGARLSLTGGSRPRTARFGTKVRVAGKLVDHAGHAMAAATVDVRTVPTTPGAASARLATLTTDKAGRFKAVFPARASGTIQVAYPDHRGGEDYSAVRAFKLQVDAKVALHAPATARRGARVTFTGKVSFDPAPAAGQAVVIQALRSSGWGDVKALTIDGAGRFTWKYRFANRGRFRFRAKVLRSGAATPGTSPAITLRIR
jgi:hypothetical protein